MTAAPDIFLSYNREDQARAKLFADAFMAAGLNVWWDTALRTGEAYDEVTETALRTAKAVVVLWSKKSVQSRWVRAEATLADRNKTLVPCMIEPCDRPIMFELTQTAELSHWTGQLDDAIWRGFLTDVTRFVGAAAKPAPLSAAQSENILAAAKQPVLAVLAFENLSAESELQFFSDGVAEEILSMISRAPGVRVIGSTSSFAFRGERKKDAARALGASHVLDGSVRRGGAKVRISATLTEAQSGQVLWTDRFDRDLADALAVQDEIAELTAEALKSNLAPSQPAARIDQQAYDLYLRALTERRAPDPPAQRKAIAYLEAAVAIEPTFARAQAALALAACLKVRDATFADAKSSDFDEAVAYVRLVAHRALALDPTDIEARIALTSLSPITESWSTLHDLLKSALAATANDANLLSLYHRFLFCIGRFADGWVVVGQAASINPLSPHLIALRGAESMLGGDLNAADVLSLQAFEAAPQDPHVFIVRLAFLNVSGRHSELLALYETGPQSLSGQGAARLALGQARRDPTPANLAAYVSISLEMLEQYPFDFPSNIAGLLLLGLFDEAFELASIAIATHSAGRLWTLWNGHTTSGGGTDFLLTPYFRSFQYDARFLPLCHKLGLCAFWASSGLWPDFIEEAEDRAALQARVHDLAGVTA